MNVGLCTHEQPGINPIETGMLYAAVRLLEEPLENPVGHAGPEVRELPDADARQVRKDDASHGED